MFCQIPSCPRRARHGNYCKRHFEAEVGPILPAIPADVLRRELMEKQNRDKGAQS